MNLQGENSTACARGSSEKAPTRPLHNCACYFISLTHTLLERITRMPFFIGPIIKCVEITVDRWTHPLTHSLEYHGLCILAAVDDKISAMGTCIFCTATQLKSVLSLLKRQGVVGTSAGLWLKYEGMVKEDIQKAVCLANKVPLEVKIESLNTELEAPSCIDSAPSLVILKQEVKIESLNTELEAPSCIDSAPMINMAGVDDVRAGGKLVSVDDFVKNEGRNERMDDFVKHNVPEKDVSVDGVILGETHTLTAHDIVEDDTHLADAGLADVNIDEGSTAAEKRPLLLTQGGDDNLPDVLEMIESSWLLGKCPAQTRLISKPPTYDFKIRIKAFFCG